MNGRLLRGLSLTLGALIALTHMGCSEELEVQTQSGRTTFELGETVVIEAFDRGKRVSEAMLGDVVFRWAVRNTTHDTHYVDAGRGAAFVTSQLKPGKNFVELGVTNDPNYAFPPSGGITIYVTENGVLPPPASTPSFEPEPAPAAVAPAATAAPDPAPAAPPTAPSGTGSSAGILGAMPGGSQ